MIKNPTVSIVMSTYNDGIFLDETIQSVRKQTYRDWEFIIINDASTDNTHEVIIKYLTKDDRLRYFKRKRNVGITKNLNVGIKHAKGKYIARIDGDDIWLDRNKLRRQVDIMNKNSNCILLGTWAKAINQNGKTLFSLRYKFNNDDIKKQLLFENCFIQSSVIFRISTVRKIGAYTPYHRFAQDYSLCLKLGRFGDVMNLPEEMVGYRINPNGISQQNYTKQINEAIDIVRYFGKYYPGYKMAIIIWNLRKFYPRWVNMGVAQNIKNLIINRM